jgi:aspartokinase
MVSTSDIKISCGISRTHVLAAVHALHSAFGLDGADGAGEAGSGG